MNTILCRRKGHGKGQIMSERLNQAQQQLMKGSTILIFLWNLTIMKIGWWPKEREGWRDDLDNRIYPQPVHRCVPNKKDWLIDNVDPEGLIKKFYFTHTTRSKKVDLPSSLIQRDTNLLRASHWKDIGNIKQAIIQWIFFCRYVHRSKNDNGVSTNGDHLLQNRLLHKKGFQIANVKKNTTTVVGLALDYEEGKPDKGHGSSRRFQWLSLCSLVCFNKVSREVRWFDEWRHSILNHQRGYPTSDTSILMLLSQKYFVPGWFNISMSERSNKREYIYHDPFANISKFKIQPFSTTPEWISIRWRKALNFPGFLHSNAKTTSLFASKSTMLICSLSETTMMTSLLLYILFTPAKPLMSNLYSLLLLAKPTKDKASKEFIVKVQQYFTWE